MKPLQPGPRRARNSSSRVKFTRGPPAVETFNQLQVTSTRVPGQGPWLARVRSAGCPPQPLSCALTTVTDPDSMITRHSDGDTGMIQS
eukprot:2946425-Rhodomonas_salina.1